MGPQVQCSNYKTDFSWVWGCMHNPNMQESKTGVFALQD